MIKATIQNSPYCTEIRFPCTETELSKKLGEIGMNTEHRYAVLHHALPKGLAAA